MTELWGWFDTMNFALKKSLAALAMTLVAVPGSLAQEQSAPPPAPPAPPPSGGDLIEAQAYRIRTLPKVRARSVEYEGALIRLRQRAQRHDKSRKSEEAKWRKGIENVSYDLITGEPQGIHLFMIKF